MKNYSKFLILVLISGLILTSSASAQTTTSTATSTDTLSALQAMIIQLEQQIKVLKEQLSQLETQTKAVKEELRIARNLQVGSRGDDVRDLQKFLKEHPEFYPEGLVTGYFGPLTRSAIKKFQIKYELKGSGDVDDYTIKKLKLVFEGAGKSGKTPYGLLIAPGIAKKIDFGTSSIATGTLPYGIAKKIDKEWKKDKKDDDHDDDCDNDHDDDGDDNDSDHNDDDNDCQPNNATSTPPTADTTAPVISGIVATSTTATSTMINWSTNELASGKIWYGTSTPINTSSTPSVSTSTLSLSHQFELAGLTASSTYYYVVGSSDAANNAATSTQQSFTTLAPATAQ